MVTLFAPGTPAPVLRRARAGVPPRHRRADAAGVLPAAGHVRAARRVGGRGLAPAVHPATTIGTTAADGRGPLPPGVPRSQSTAVLAASMPARIEWYPLTNIPMYSSYVDGKRSAALPMDTFADEQLAVRGRPGSCSAHPSVVHALPRRRPALPPAADQSTSSSVGALTGSASGWLRSFWRDELADGRPRRSRLRRRRARRG